jgi:hypothetical protein
MRGRLITERGWAICWAVDHTLAEKVMVLFGGSSGERQRKAKGFVKKGHTLFA